MRHKLEPSRPGAATLVGVRMSDDEVAKLDSLAELLNESRSTVLRRLLHMATVEEQTVTKMVVTLRGDA